MKKRSFIISMIALSGLICGVSIGIASAAINPSSAFIKAHADDNVSIHLDSSNTPEALTAAYNNAVATPSRYTALTYHQAKKLSGYHCVLDNGGYIYNSGQAINNISRIVVNIEGAGTLKTGLTDEIDDFSFALANGENVINISANYFKLIANEETKLVSLTVTYPMDCEANPAQTTGDPATGLGLTRIDENEVRINFTENALKTYEVRINGVLAKTAAHDGDVLAFPLQEGSFNVELREINATSHTVSDWDVVATTMSDKRVSPLALNDTVDYFGWLVDNAPFGSGKLVYYTDNTKAEAGSTFIGTLETNFFRKEGTLTFSNGMRYIGKFVNDAYHDAHGSFDWATRDGEGNVTAYGWLFEGGFANGTMAGQYGDFYFPGYFTHDYTGVWKLEHALADGFPGFAANQTTTSGIWVSWSDTSDQENNNTYYGPINVDGNKNFNTTGLSGRLVIGCRENKEIAYGHPTGWYLWEGPVNNAAWPLDSAVGTVKWGFGGSTFIGKVEWHGENDTTINTRFNYPQYPAYNYFWDSDNSWQCNNFAGQGVDTGAKCITYYGQFDGAWCKGYGIWVFDNGTYVKGYFEDAAFVSAWDSEHYGSYHAFDVNVDVPEAYRAYTCVNA